MPPIIEVVRSSSERRHFKRQPGILELFAPGRGIKLHLNNGFRAEIKVCTRDLWHVRSIFAFRVIYVVWNWFPEFVSLICFPRPRIDWFGYAVDSDCIPIYPATLCGSDFCFLLQLCLRNYGVHSKIYPAEQRTNRIADKANAWKLNNT